MNALSAKPQELMESEMLRNNHSDQLADRAARDPFSKLYALIASGDQKGFAVASQEMIDTGVLQPYQLREL